ncbi:hypothetical protein [Gemmata sp.]|uniref:hypothetical protein n=1 Tax=Gemmata sp. TaxID=1914242 RepID=UPI003F72BB90
MLLPRGAGVLLSACPACGGTGREATPPGERPRFGVGPLGRRAALEHGARHALTGAALLAGGLLVTWATYEFALLTGGPTYVVAVGATLGGGTMVLGGALSASFALGRRVGLALTWSALAIVAGAVAWGVVKLLAWTYS